MSEVAAPEVASRPEPSGLNGLLQFLRESPHASTHSADDLARRFHVDSRFVRDVLHALKEPVPEPEPSAWSRIGPVLAAIGGRLERIYLRITSRPEIFVGVTGLLATIALIGFSQLFSSRSGTDGSNFGLANSGATPAILMTMIGLHLICYFRAGMLRYPLSGGVLAFVVLVPAIQYETKTNIELTAQGETVPVRVIVMLALVLSALYTALGSMGAVIGGYWRIKRDVRAEGSLSRQDLLDRLFQIEERLRQIEADPKRTLRPGTKLEQIRAMATYPLIAGLAGVLIGALEVSVLSSVAMIWPRQPNGSNAVLETVMLVMMAIKLMFYIAVGFVAGGVRRGFLSLLLAYAGITTAMLLPLGPYGPAHVTTIIVEWRFIPSILLIGLVAILSGIGAHVEDRAQAKKRLRSNDPAALLAEAVQIQWRLAPRSEARCVMVVDVARSTAMKAEADPLLVEWSFREYHKMIEEITRRQAGDVLSTAGDGMVASFCNCPQALFAAKQIQTQIGRFNTKTNRLPSPFRLRIGLHAGEVKADLLHVPFSEIIDVAAHIESAAPVGGIAITDTVQAELEDEPLAEMRDEVDGRRVYVVLNPTIGA